MKDNGLIGRIRSLSMSNLLPVGLYKTHFHFYYRAKPITKPNQWSWMELDIRHPEMGWSETSSIYNHLEPSNPLEFVLLTGLAFDAEVVEKEYRRIRAEWAIQRGINKRAAKMKRKNENDKAKDSDGTL